MDLQIKTKNLRLTEGLEEYIHRRVQKLDRVHEPVIDAKFELRSEKPRTGGERIVAQLTIATRASILRAEEKNHDVHLAVDLAVERMARQIRRFHDKKVHGRRRQRQLNHAEHAPIPPVEALMGEEGLESEDEGPTTTLVRRKRFKVQPMNEEEAVEQMELLGHDFFVFFNPDEAQINVLYRRKDGQYGVIQPELA